MLGAADQSVIWQSVESNSPDAEGATAWVEPAAFRACRLNHVALRAVLERAPRQFTFTAKEALIELALPMPDGQLARFRVAESPIMAPELAARFPEIKTYCGQGIDDPAASVRFDVTPSGLHAQILSPRGAVYIDPHWRGNWEQHVVYFKRDYQRAENFECLTPGDNQPSIEAAAALSPAAAGGTLRIFRLAVAATGEYTQFHGGTVSAGLAAIITAINRVDGIYESELGIRLVLVANNDRIVFTNAATDPYDNGDPVAMLSQNQTTIDALIGDANYDVGQVFCTGGGGLSTTAIVCT